MSILPTWPIAAGCLAIGVLLGAGGDRLWMAPKVAAVTKKYNDLVNDNKEASRLAEVQRGIDERAARTKEQLQAKIVAEIEQEKTDEISRLRSDADALIARLRKQAASKPANPSGMPSTCTPSEIASGGTVPIGVGEDLVTLAQRADELRAALGACYKAYDSIR